MLIETGHAFYRIEKTEKGYCVERIGCTPKGADNSLVERVSYEGNLLVFNPQGEMVLFADKDRQVLKTAPIIFPQAQVAPQT